MLIDSLFAIPDIRMSERIFALVLALREKTTKTLIIQTRADDTTIFEQALAGDLAPRRVAPRLRDDNLLLKVRGQLPFVRRVRLPDVHHQERRALPPVPVQPLQGARLAPAVFGLFARR